MTILERGFKKQFTKNPQTKRGKKVRRILLILKISNKSSLYRLEITFS
ncbi:hypothetical protein LEP1GSC038_4022 [Leptospira weilii str. 2006001855]|uniref:Uncharacterized protein n=1 Tax=Leptospira weilii str. 2006001855 TaxID=996804 RepID=M6FNX8_9LEPT|nr:hypothetical protein LEP1GSC038_4022 [Leptospira weilii str. 2006001855]